MRLTELHRTTGFRLATLFLMLFGVIAILLFGYLYREITGFEQERIDDWLIRVGLTDANRRLTSGAALPELAARLIA